MPMENPPRSPKLAHLKTSIWSSTEKCVSVLIKGSITCTPSFAKRYPPTTILFPSGGLVDLNPTHRQSVSVAGEAPRREGGFRPRETRSAGSNIISLKALESAS